MLTMEKMDVSEDVISGILEQIVRECCRIERRIENVLERKEGRDELGR